MRIYVKYLIITFLEIYFTLLTAVTAIVLADKGLYPELPYHLALFALYLLKLTSLPYAFFSLAYVVMKRARTRGKVTIAKRRFL